MLKQLALFILFLFIATYIAGYFLQRHFIYFPSNEVPDRTFFHAQDMQQIKLKTSNNLLLNAWYKPATANLPTIVYFHGNGGHIGHRMGLIRYFLTKGYGVLLFDYRGYGGNQGTPSEQGLYDDGQAAMSFLLTHNIESRHIVLYGESLGTAVATQMALNYPVCALVLQSALTSLPDLARYHYPWILIPPRDKFDSLSRIKKIKSPILMLHGEQDNIVPYKQGQVLFSEANEPKQWISFSGKSHNDLWDNQFATAVDKFISTQCTQ